MDRVYLCEAAERRWATRFILKAEKKEAGRRGNNGEQHRQHRVWFPPLQAGGKLKFCTIYHVQQLSRAFIKPVFTIATTTNCGKFLRPQIYYELCVSMHFKIMRLFLRIGSSTLQIYNYPWVTCQQTQCSKGNKQANSMMNDVFCGEWAVNGMLVMAV